MGLYRKLARDIKEGDKITLATLVDDESLPGHIEVTSVEAFGTDIIVYCDDARWFLDRNHTVRVYDKNMTIPLHRQITGSDKRYEVLEEMTEMWWQASAAAMQAGRDAEAEPGVKTLSSLAAKSGAREAWEQAIMVYAGWDGARLERYIAQVMIDKTEAMLRG